MLISIGMLSISTIGGSGAHDYQHPELNGWYESLHSSKGPCCEGTDAKRIDEADWDSKGGHYRVRIDGEWVDVPKQGSRARTKPGWSYDGVALLPKWSSEGALLRAGKHGLIASAPSQRPSHRSALSGIHSLIRWLLLLKLTRAATADERIRASDGRIGQAGQL
jgi:hypothetical protein